MRRRRHSLIFKIITQNMFYFINLRRNKIAVTKTALLEQHLKCAYPFKIQKKKL